MVVKPIIAILLLTSASGLYAKNKHPKKPDGASPDSRDTITVVAHIPLGGGAVTSFTSTQHYDRSYVYAEHESGKSVTLIDVTNVNRPEVLGEMANPNGSTSESLVAATGNIALESDSPAGDSKAATAQTLRIMDFSDAAHPLIAQEFKGVTAVSRDTGKNLIFLANSDGIWILRQHFGEDPAVDREYNYEVIYGESMYRH
jgi:hypothetical protein